jgi:hypothetical protein
MAVGSSAAGDGADLVGDIGDGSQTSDEGSGNQGALDAVSAGVAAAAKDADAQQREVERKLVKMTWAAYEEAREFDKPARGNFADDRKYAAGLSDPSWASDANLIGSFIDILTSFLYAQNPDVSVKPAEQVGTQPNDDMTAFAETMELIISRLWKLAKLKKTVRRMVRSTLTVGQGWMKAIMWSKKRPQPAIEADLHDAQAQMARIQLLVSDIKDGNVDQDLDVEQAKLAEMIGALRAKIMKNKEYGLNADYVRAEDIQVSLDVSTITDYEVADWISEDMYIPKKSLRARFDRLTQEDEDRAVLYYQKNLPANAKGDVLQAATGDEAMQGTYTKTAPNTQGGGSKPVAFVKIVELWDRRDGNIKTMCDGLERWAVEPYPPPQASNRFYAYFCTEFYPVDGHRHPQSLAGRLRKLQDEYSACRSNQRLTRERSIPGLIFNAGAMGPEDAKKLEDSVIAEMVGIKPTDITMPIQNIIMAKPVPPIDTRLWDTTAIRADMESLSGVQEAMQQANTAHQPKTATEAQIEQTGFASRTSADRDAIEDMLTDLAQYSAETGIQEIDPVGAQRIAGGQAFWPYGMDIQDLLTMVSVDIEAGTSGKPDLAADKANWATILPMLQKLMVQIRQIMGQDPALATALTNLLKETLKRMDDRLDIDDFIPQTPPPPPPPAPQPKPNVSVSLKGVLPALDAAAIGAQAAGLPPEAMLAGGGAGGPPAVLPGAPDHPGAHVADGEIPLHPHMPQPLPAAVKTPAQGGETQKPQV